MPAKSRTSQRRRAIATALAIAVSPFGSALIFAAPNDSLAEPTIALTAPSLEAPTDSRAEVSLLTRSTGNVMSVGDLPLAAEQMGEAAPALTVVEAKTASELLQTRFANGQVQVERYITEDAEGNLVNHGPYKEYDSSGKLIRSGRYEIGQLDGTWTQVIDTNDVQSLGVKLDAGFKPPFQSEADFVLGQLHGNWTVTDFKGSPVFVWQFEFGKRENISTWFDSRRSPVTEILYKDGLPNGPSKQMLSGQREPKQVVYDQGRELQVKTNWYEQGKKKRSEESLLIPSASLIVSHDWWNSELKSETPTSGNTVRHGEYTAWYPNGQKSLEGRFDSGEPSGEFQWWYPNGQPQIKGYYLDGKSVGPWVWWHPEGMKMREGSFDAGIQIGQWSQWDTDGRLTLRDDAANFPQVNSDIQWEALQIVETDAASIETRTAMKSAPQPTSRQHSVPSNSRKSIRVTPTSTRFQNGRSTR